MSLQFQIRFRDSKLSRRKSKILESLHDWFELDESREKYMADCVNWIFLSAKENYEYAGFLCLKKIGDATVELEVIKEIWGEENLCQIYIMSLI